MPSAPAALTSARLSRATWSAPCAPIRIVHIGLGAFHRAHQAWYTYLADPAKQWGIAAFTGTRPDAARRLSRQDGLYTLIVRSRGADDFTIIDTIVEANNGADLTRLAELVAASTTALITLTITEAAYTIGSGGSSGFDAAVARDVEHLKASGLAGAIPANLDSVPAKLVLGLAARRAADGGPVAVMSCDNLAANGERTSSAVRAVAKAVDGELDEWIGRNVSFVSTSVDRITPRPTPADLALVEAECGYIDDAPVVTEPFSDWVIMGEFPAGRPPWEQAGASFVDEIGPFERRKLWLLNGAHSLMAYLGQLHGLSSVAAAIEEPQCRSGVEALWDLAGKHLLEPDLRLLDYRARLLERFRNYRIMHTLAQIAVDGSTKLSNRVVPIVEADRATGSDGAAALLVVAAWAEYVCRLPAITADHDANAAAIESAVAMSGPDRTRALVGILEPSWASDDAIVQGVDDLRKNLPSRDAPFRGRATYSTDAHEGAP